MYFPHPTLGESTIGSATTDEIAEKKKVVQACPNKSIEVMPKSESIPLIPPPPDIVICLLFYRMKGSFVYEQNIGELGLDFGPPENGPLGRFQPHSRPKSSLARDQPPPLRSPSSIQQSYPHLK